MGGRVLLASHDAGGTVPPMLALAESFIGARHEVVWLGQPSIEPRATRAGCTFVAWHGVPSYEPRVEIEEQVATAMALIALTEAGEQLATRAAEDRSDLIVVDANLAGCLAAAEASNVSSAVLLHSMYATFVEIWLPEVWPLLEPFINDTREHFGLPGCDGWGGVLAGHDRLVGVVPERFEGLVDAPPTLRHWGFLVPKTPLGGASVTFPDDDRPRVLVGLSTTYQHQEDALQTILDALARLDVSGIASTAGQVDANAVRCPPNATLHEFVDHQSLLSECDVMVTHAGLATVAAALSRGVPLVCAPLGRDQHLNASRVTGCGAGIVVDPAAGADVVADAVRRVLDDGRYREAARRVAEQSRAAGGAEAAVRDLERLFAS